jgi:hypothetical protein
MISFIKKDILEEKSMEKYLKILNKTIKEYFKKDSLIIFLLRIPIHASVIFLFSICYVIIFLMYILELPSEYIRIKNQLNEEENLIAQAIVVGISYPFVFGFHVINSFLFIPIGVSFFIIVILGKIVKLGKFEIHPFITYINI